ncbi:MAG: sialidase family protein [Phycisphaerales bacterium]
MRGSCRLRSRALICACGGALACGTAAFAQTAEEFGLHEVMTGADLHPGPVPNLPTSDPFFMPRGFPSTVQVNVGSNGQNIVGDAANEPSMASQAKFPNKIAIGWRQFDTISSSFRQAGYAWSDDWGRSWHRGTLNPGVFRSDPVLRADADGTIFYNSLTSDFECFYFKSTDGGQTWSAPVFAWGGDKAWFAIDKSNTSRRGAMIQAWNCCAFNRSFNGAQTWSAPAGDLGILFGTLDIGPSGEVYVIGQDGTVRITKSTNALDPNVTPPTFSPTQQIFISAGANNRPPNPGGLIGQHQVLVEKNVAERMGWVYALSTINSTGSATDIGFRRSTDGGATWGAITLINGGIVNANSWQWFGTMGLAPNGRIDVVYNDTSSTLNPVLSRTMYVFSNDAGVTWSAPESLGPTWNSAVGWPQQNKIGDYYDIESDNNGFNLIYSATYNGEQDLYFVRHGARFCDSIDFNNDGSLFDPQDIDALLSVYGEGPCVPATATCYDIDFNNDGSVFDPADIDGFLSVYGEGPCNAG